MKRFKHWLAHLTGYNLGHVVTFWGQDGQLRIAHKCGGCGAVSACVKGKARRRTGK